MRERKDLGSHILGTVYLVVNDLRFQELNEKDKNILKWASLLHDLMKKTYPADLPINSRDLVHPYNCALKALEIGQILKKKNTEIDFEYIDY